MSAHGQPAGGEARAIGLATDCDPSAVADRRI